MTIRTISVLAIALVLTASSAGVLRAQDEIEHLSPFANGAGRTYAITSRGLDAVGLNPSLLALGTPRPFELTLAPISSLGLNAGPSLSQVNSISQGLQASGLSSTETTTNGLTKGDSTRESIANLLSNNNLSSTIDARIFGISYDDGDAGTFAFTWTMHAALRASIPSELLNYIGVGALARLGQGNTLPPQQPDVQGMWYSEYTLSYARTLIGTPFSGEEQLLGGVGVKYLAGIAAIQMDPASEFSANYPSAPPQGGAHSVGVDYRIYSAYPNAFNFTHLPSGFSTSLITNATAGLGLGADIGFTLGAFDSASNAPWEVALSVTDIGSINWDQNASVRTADTVVAASNSQGNKDTLNAQLKVLGGTLNNTIGSFTTQLPTTIHAAGALDLSAIGLSFGSSKLEAAAEFALGLTNTVGSPNHGRFGFAVIIEQPGSGFSWHSALGYTTQDGVSDLTAAIGFGIANRILFDAGTDGLTALFSKTGHTDAVFGIKVLL